jgi:hypothetical protein
VKDIKVGFKGHSVHNSNKNSLYGELLKCFLLRKYKAIPRKKQKKEEI